METEQESQEQSADTACTDAASKKTRVRLKSPRLQLQVTLQRMEKLAQSNTLKEAKAADLLMSMADLQKTLLQLALDEKKDTQTAEHAALSAQHASDAEKIATLEAQNAELKERARPQLITVESPESAQIKERNASFAAVLKYVVSFVDAGTDARAQLAIQVIQKFSEFTARIFLPMIHADYAQYRRLLTENKPEQELLSIVEKSSNPNGDLVVFARAALAVIHNCDVSKPKVEPRATQPFDPASLGILESKLAGVRQKRAALLGQPMQEADPVNETSGESFYRDSGDWAL